MPIKFFATTGRIEGPVTMANIYRLDGPLGPQDFSAAVGAASAPQEQLVPPTAEAAKAEEASPSGVPAATRAR